MLKKLLFVAILALPFAAPAPARADDAAPAKTMKKAKKGKKAKKPKKDAAADSGDKSGDAKPATP